MAREPDQAAVTAEPDAAVPVGPLEETVVEDRGSFSHAVCGVCGWSGPGRRSRQVARADASDHGAGAHQATQDEGPLTPGKSTDGTPA